MAQRDVTDDEMVDAACAGAAAMFMGGAAVWWYHRRELAGGRVLYLFPIFAGNRLGVSKNAQDDGFEDVFDYPDVDASWKAALGWDGQGDPDGWVRHSKWGEGDCRRRPDGKPESEYRAP